MKKLMIAVAAVAMGFAANASNVTWGGNTSAYTGVTSGYNFYLVNAANYATAADAVAALMDGSIAAADIWYTKTGSASNNKVGLTVNNKQASGSAAPDGALNSKPFSVYSIVFDGTVGTGGTAEHYFSMTGDDPFSGTASAAGLAAVQLGDTSAKSTWQSVPEPTSGLLLLLGVAGLALRRRRA